MEAWYVNEGALMPKHERPGPPAKGGGFTLRAPVVRAPSYTIDYTIPVVHGISSTGSAGTAGTSVVTGPMTAYVPNGQVLQVGRPGERNKVKVTITNLDGSQSVQEQVIQGAVNIAVRW